MKTTKILLSILTISLLSCSKENDTQKTCTGKFTYDWKTFFYITNLPINDNGQPLNNNHPNSDAWFCGCIN